MFSGSKTRILAIAAATAGLVALLPMSQASAELVYELNTEFSGAADPAGTGTWVEATFYDSTDGVLDPIYGDVLDTNEVLLTIDTSGLEGTEFVSVALFNVTGHDLTMLDIELDTPSDAPSGTGTFANDADTSQSGFKADGDGYFDLRLDFDNTDFTDNETVSFLITSGDGVLTTEQFLALSIGSGNSPEGLYAAAHVQSIAPTDCNDGRTNELCTSGWITDPPVPAVPIPGAAWLFGSALLGLIGFSRIRRRREAVA